MVSEPRERFGKKMIIHLEEMDINWRRYMQTAPKRDGPGKAAWYTQGSLLALSPFHLSAFLAASFDFSSLKPLPSWLRSCTGRGLSGTLQDPLDIAECGGQVGESLKLRNPQSHLQDTLGEEYWANDGVVPLFSQWHPLPCRYNKHTCPLTFS
jgi:hypothetical protein